MPLDLGHDPAGAAPGLGLVAEAGVVTPDSIGRTAHRTLEQMSDPAVENSISRKADHVPVVLRFQEFVDLRRGKTRIGAEVAPLHRGSVAGDDRLQHLTPALGGVNVAGPQGTAFQVTELVEHEERVVAGAAEVAVVSGPFLLAKGGADTGVHVEHDPPHRTTSMDAVDPAPGQISERGQVRRLGQHLGLEPAHLAGRGRLSSHGLTTYHPAHSRIMRQPVRVVHVLVPRQAPEHRLAKLSNQGMASVRAGAGVRQYLSSGLAQTEGIVEFAAGQQAAIRRDLRSVELQLEAAVKCQAKSAVLCFTDPRFHSTLPLSPVSY